MTTMRNLPRPFVPKSAEGSWSKMRKRCPGPTMSTSPSSKSKMKNSPSAKFWFISAKKGSFSITRSSTCPSSNPSSNHILFAGSNSKLWMKPMFYWGPIPNLKTTTRSSWKTMNTKRLVRSLLKRLSLASLTATSNFRATTTAATSGKASTAISFKQNVNAWLAAKMLLFKISFLSLPRRNRLNNP